MDVFIEYNLPALWLFIEDSGSYHLLKLWLTAKIMVKPIWHS